MISNLKMARAYRVLLCAALFSSGLTAYASGKEAGTMPDNSAAESVKENITVTGTVKDPNGEPLIGVGVMEKGTTHGMITDLDGRFSLSVSGPDAVLEFSYVGYNPVSVAVGNQSNLNIVMSESTQDLDEVVVTALGIKREKKMLGYAVQDIKADKLNTTGDPSVIGALSGKVAGLQMNTAGTGLSGSTKITLRGNSSLTDNNQPLWVIDGVPFSDNSSSDASLFGGIDRGGSAVDINPEDIESISVLKGPNAAALYGSRAGNGVILITTKRGVKDKGFGVSYSGNFTWSSVASSLEQQTTYGQGKNGVFDPNVFESFGARLDGHTYTGWLGQELQYKDYGNKFDQYFNTGFTQSHNVAIGKSEENYNYRASFGSTDSKGLFDGEGLNKINIDLKAGMKMNKYLSMDSKISLSRTKATDRPQYGKGGEVYQLLYIPRNIPLSDLKTFRSDEQRHIYYVNPSLQEMNPYYINYQYSNMDERWRAFGYYTVKVDFTPWLYATGKYTFDYYNTSIEEMNRTNGIDDQTKESYKSMEQRYYEHNIEGMIMGHNTFAERFRLGYSLGGNIMYQRTSGLTGYSENMAKADVWYHNSALGKNTAEQSFTERSTRSVFGTLQLAWDEWIALDLTARNDWSSTLPRDNCSYFYPSANLSWVFSDMMRRYDWGLPQWITFGKVRLSAAQVGKDTDPYLLYNYLTYTQGVSGPEISYPKIKANPDLKPEISSAYEAGLDMKFFNNRLGFDFTYYRSLTKNQIMSVPMSGEFSAKYINAGKILNEGVELMLYTTPIRVKDFDFNLDVSLAHNNTTVVELHEDAKYMSFNFKNENMLVDVGAEEGGRLGNIYANTFYARNENGELLLRNGMPMIKSNSSAERKCIGNIQPDLLMSVTPSFNYKGFFLSAMFDMRFGGDIVSVSEAIATRYGTAKRTEFRPAEGIVLDGIDEATGLKNTIAIPAEEYYRSIGGDNAPAEEFVYDASYIKFKELSIGYSFPSKWLKKIHVSNLRLALVGRNLCYLLKHTPGTSPEGGYDTTMFSQAIDYTAVPYTRTLGFSVNIGF
ncbi:MAG TPA: SusC/RagA family TonB-linked outer membrane protein [Candidatus Barnesiella excrementavium]|nr:SusC/RagA family TonB-linked outer membrane protein [Candidatus Barnesiella excrementavium]